MQRILLGVGAFSSIFVYVRFDYLFFRETRLKFLSPTRGQSSRATQELWNLLKQKVLKETLKGEFPITELAVDDSEETKARQRGFTPIAANV